MTFPLPPALTEAFILRALEEDLAHGGDLTSLATIDAATTATASLNSREAGVAAGVDLAAQVFTMVDPSVHVTVSCRDGAKINPGQALFTAEGPARALLTAERTALNLLSHLSGIATLTAAYVQKIEGTKAQIAGTRKTLPGLRVFQKHAIRAGGGMTHRMSLSDAVMIKDNHIVAAGSIAKAIDKARAFAGHTVTVEVEVDTLDQLAEALAARPDIVLLDNMSTEDLKEAVRMTSGRAVLEASGGVNLKTVRGIAETGVDVISVGSLTHSARSIDIGMELTV